MAKTESKRKKIMRVALIVISAITILPLIGLICTGYYIGWGPFAKLCYYNTVNYHVSENEYSFKREQVEIDGPNGTIRGYLFTPSTEVVPGKIVILSHGYATEQWHNLNTANSLAIAGIKVLSFDYCGGSIHAESDGKTTDMSVVTEVADLNAVIDAVKGYDGVDPNKIDVIGYSQGGFVAALTSVGRNDIEKLCLVYPAFVIPSNNPYTSVDEIPSTTTFMGMTIGKKYYEDLLNLNIGDVYEYVATYANPVLLIHGTKDKLVPYESSVKANEAYPNSELKTIQNGGHGFNGNDDIQAVKWEYEFVSK